MWNVSTKENKNIPVLECCCVPAAVGSDPRSEVDLWTRGRGPKALQRSTAPPPAPPPPADSPTSMLLLLLEEPRSDPALMNQLLQTKTGSVDTEMWTACARARARVPSLLLGGAVWRAGRRGLGGGGQPFLSGFQTLDLQLLRCERTPFNKVRLPLTSHRVLVSQKRRFRRGHSHLERVGDSMVMLGLLSHQAFMGCVAGVGKPRPLLKRLHTVLSLLWDTQRRRTSEQSCPLLAVCCHALKPRPSPRSRTVTGNQKGRQGDFFRLCSCT